MIGSIATWIVIANIISLFYQATETSIHSPSSTARKSTFLSIHRLFVVLGWNLLVAIRILLSMALLVLRMDAGIILRLVRFRPVLSGLIQEGLVGRRALLVLYSV